MYHFKMSRVTLQELMSHVGVSAEVLKEPCTEAHLSKIALWLPDWQIAAPHLGVSADARVHQSTREESVCPQSMETEICI